MGVDLKKLYDNEIYLIIIENKSQVKQLAENLKNVVPHKNTLEEISLTDFYEEKTLPKSFILIANDIEVVLPMYRENIASLIGLRINNKKFTVLPTVDAELVMEKYKNTIFKYYFDKHTIVFS